MHAPTVINVHGPEVTLHLHYIVDQPDPEYNLTDVWKKVPNGVRDIDAKVVCQKIHVFLNFGGELIIGEVHVEKLSRHFRMMRDNCIPDLITDHEEGIGISFHA